MNVPVRMQAAIARGHGQPWFVATMPRTAAAVPAVKPADRSISPSSSTNTRPIAMTMTPADWLKRFAKLNWLVNVSPRSEVKTMTRTISPSTAGSEPTSPLRTLTT